MKPIIRTTWIEKFRRYINDTSSYDTEQSVIDTICGEFKGNTRTRIGTAFHSIVEKGTPYTGEPISVDGNDVYFNEKQWQTALDYRNQFSVAFHEMRRYKDYGNAIVTGCADLIDCFELHDIKTKYSTPKDTDYIDSCQWRYYLDIFGLDVFHFDLFIFKDYHDECGYDVRGLELEQHTPPITCYRYPKMEHDNINLLNQMLDWAALRNVNIGLW